MTMKRVFQLPILFMILTSGCRTSENSDLGGASFQEQRVLSYVDYGWNAERMSDLQGLLSEDYVRKLNGIQVAHKPVELEAYIQNYQRAFPNLKINVERMVESDSLVVAFWTFEGTNTGEFGEFIPTGKKARVSGVSLFAFDPDGKIVSEDTYYNELYLLQQLGYNLIPPNLE